MTPRHRMTIFACLLLIPVLALTSGACSRVIIITGTTLGIKATPGDLNGGRPPQVTLGYKRAETALVPTNGDKSKHENSPEDVDALSTLASFYLSTQWFGDTQVQSFIATGYAAQELQSTGGAKATNAPSAFNEAFANATLNMLPEAIRKRRRALSNDVTALDDAGVAHTLSLAGCPIPPGMSPADARAALDACIKSADTDAELQNLERAVGQSH